MGSFFKLEQKKIQQFFKFSEKKLCQRRPDTVQIISMVFDLIKKNQSSDELKKSLTVLETAVKSQNKLLRDEIVKESNCEIFAKLIITTPHAEVREKMMSLIQVWAFMFKDPKYCALEVSLVGFLNFLVHKHSNIFKIK
jgi:phosphoenolpyruvate carboxylase